MIPKAGGKLRRLGIPTIADRVVQASLKLVLEPIFEADFLPCSYGFRPKRRAHDAVAEVRYLASKPRCYEWIVEGDIKACFDITAAGQSRIPTGFPRTPPPPDGRGGPALRKTLHLVAAVIEQPRCCKRVPMEPEERDAVVRRQ